MGHRAQDGSGPGPPAANAGDASPSHSDKSGHCRFGTVTWQEKRSGASHRYLSRSKGQTVKVQPELKDRRHVVAAAGGTNLKSRRSINFRVSVAATHLVIDSEFVQTAHS